MRTRFALAAWMLGLLLSLVLAELGLRMMNLGFGNSPMEPDPYLHHGHPRNYRFVQQHPSGELGGFEIAYNAEGRVVRGRGVAAPGSPSRVFQRGGATAPTPPRAPDPAGVAWPPTGAPCRVAFMGDSFVEAGQVPFAESFAGLLEEAAGPRCEIRNYGTRSYSPAIYLVQWTRNVATWRPTHVYLLLFGGDVREDVEYLKGAVLDAEGFPTAIPGPSDRWLISALRRSYVARFVRMASQRALWAYAHRGQPQWTIGGVVEENPEWTGPTPRLVRELNRRVTAAGSHLVVMAVPSRYRLMGDGSIPVNTDFHADVKRWCTENGIDFLDLYGDFAREVREGRQPFFLQDIHFTADGHKVVAAAIARRHPETFGAIPSEH